MSKRLLFVAIAFFTTLGMSAQVIFHETFDKLTLDVTGQALESGFTDEIGYIVGGGGSGMKCVMDGIFTFGNGRFRTRTMDLSGNDVQLIITWRFSPEQPDRKRFQIDIDKEGTSGMGGILNIYNDAEDAPYEFVEQIFTITGGTAESYLHFRVENGGLADIDEIKVVRGGASIDLIEADKQVVAVEYYDLLGKRIYEPAEGIFVKKSKYEDGSVSSQKFFLRK